MYKLVVNLHKIYLPTCMFYNLYQLSKTKDPTTHIQVTWDNQERYTEQKLGLKNMRWKL